MARETDIPNIQIEQKPPEVSSAYSQLFFIQVQYFQPEFIQVDNGTYAFNYSSKTHPLRSFLLELGWAPELFQWHGSFYLEEQLAFSLFHGGIFQVSNLPALSGTSYSLFLFGLDTRLMYAMTGFPWKRWIPFLDLGYQYSTFYQGGDSGLEAAQGGVGNIVAGGGFRFWLNRQQSQQEGVLPFFLNFRLNHIFSSPGSLNLGSTGISGGMSLGL